MGAPPPTGVSRSSTRPAWPGRGPVRPLALALLAVAVVVAGCGGDTVTARVSGPSTAGGTEVEGRWPATTTTTTAAPTTTTTTVPATPAGDGLAIAPPLPRPWASRFTVADATGPTVELHTSPGVRVPSGRAMANPTGEGLALTFLVRGRQGPDWLQAQIMSRPNSALAWIRSDQVTERQVEHHVVIERGARRATVYAAEEVVLQVPVATGKDSSPTPLGTFFVDGIVPLSPPHRAYGTGQVSFTGFSEVYQSFGGGVGQVAMHGTQNPALVGTPASNGCVRMRNADIEAMMLLAPTGTPVEVVA
ncbi:MAG TPA: L,D-transpeptidase [Acidimicrobiales bacterium]|nr:L,D-transpeptidase [Acidimicrobiales bacterium]